MAVFDNKNPESCVTNIEFAGDEGQQFIFLHTKPRTETGKLEAWLKKTGLNLQEIARTQADGHEVIIASTSHDNNFIIQELNKSGEQLAEHVDEKGVNLWKLRGWASIIGQPMQLASGMLQKGTIDPATIGFASANMVANITNILFGAEKKDDPNRLHFLKDDINRDIDEHLPQGVKPFDPTEERTATRQTEGKTQFDAYEFMRRNSVRIGEIGLRYIGALSLAFPFVKAIPGKKPWSAEGLKEGTKHWGPAFKQLTSGKFAEAYKTIANKDEFTRGAGIAYLVGKTIAFAAQVPDPYSPQKPTTVDNVRENMLFPASSMIEAVAAGLIAYNGLFKRKINWNQPYLPKALHFGETRDYLGGVGGLLFTAGLIIRIFAPYGKKELNMQEVVAHTSDTLAQTPPEEMPRLLADSAATVYEHTRDKNIPYGEIFAAMSHDLKQYHHIAVDKKDYTQMVTAPAETAPPATEAATPHKPYADKIAKGANHVERQLQNSNPNMHLSV